MKHKPFLVVATLLAAVGCSNSRNATPPGATAGGTIASTQRSTYSPPTTLVVWISVDGFRHDYLPRSDAPFMKSLVRSGAYSYQLSPPYPSLTFTSHTSEATGASPNVHGIPGNSFFDRRLNQQFSFPPRPDLLNAEPIWTTATRQGVRVAIFDWPFSQKQSGNFASAYFAEQYEARQTDAERVGRVIDVLRYDDGPRGAGTHPAPLSLVMGYVESVDKVGHQTGPATKTTLEYVAKTDALIQAAHQQAVATLKEKFPPGSTLYFIVSTDHGMAEVKHAVNLKVILGDALPHNARIVTGGGTAHVFLPDNTPDKPAILAALKAKTTPYPFLRAFTHDTLPPTWPILDPNRIGDLYLDLTQGYTFTSRGSTPIQDVAANDASTRPTDRHPRGMHSYDPTTSPDMLGTLIVSRYPRDFGGKNLGPVDARQLAPTVSTFLNIAPPPKSEVAPIPALLPR